MRESKERATASDTVPKIRRRRRKQSREREANGGRRGKKTGWGRI